MAAKAAASPFANAASNAWVCVVAAFAATLRRVAGSGVATLVGAVGLDSDRPAVRRARSASTVAPFASQSSKARRSSASASARAPAGAERGGERETRVGVVEERVGRGRDRDGGLGERDRRRMLAAPRQGLGADAAPRDRRLQIVAREQLALVRERLGFGGAILGEERAAEQRGGARGVDAEPEIAEPVVAGTERALGGGRVAFQQIDAAREDVGLEEPMADAELLHHRARRREHAARRLGAAAQRLEHALAAERHGLDRGRALRDAEHAHDVEAAAAGARDRARSPERGERRAGEDGVGAAAIAGAARRRERLIERRLARADLAEPRQRLRVDEVRLGLAGGILQRGEVARRGADPVGRRVQRLGRGQHGELAREAGVPGARDACESAAK